MYLQESAPPLLTELWRYIVGALVVIGSNLLTYFLTRRKTNADVDKTEADTVKVQVETIASLTATIDGWIEKIQGMRTDYSALEDINLELKKVISKMKAEGHKHTVEEEISLLTAVTTTIRKVSELIDGLNNEGVSQEVRIKAVQVLEALYHLRDQIHKDILKDKE